MDIDMHIQLIRTWEMWHYNTTFNDFYEEFAKNISIKHIETFVCVCVLVVVLLMISPNWFTKYVISHYLNLS